MNPVPINIEIVAAPHGGPCELTVADCTREVKYVVRFTRPQMPGRNVQRVCSFNCAMIAIDHFLNEHDEEEQGPPAASPNSNLCGPHLMGKDVKEPVSATCPACNELRGADR